MDESTPIVSNRESTTREDDSQPIYYGEGQSRGQKCGQIISMIVAVIAALVCLGLCIRGGILKKGSQIAFLYFMFAVSVAGIALIHVLMVIFMKKGYISEGKLWFSYISGGLVVIQSILIDIVVLSKGL